jgi:hypothetical protein
VEGNTYLNTTNPEIIRFWLRRYEIPCDYIDNDWDVTDDDLVDSIHIANIVGISQLEQILAQYLDDFSKLDSEWKCDNPL